MAIYQSVTGLSMNQSGKQELSRAADQTCFSAPFLQIRMHISVIQFKADISPKDRCSRTIYAKSFFYF